MMNTVFFALLATAVAVGMLQGEATWVIAQMLEGAGQAVTTAISLAGGFAFFCGLLNLLQRAGVVRVVARVLAKPLSKLMGKGMRPEALEYMTLNLTANMLGLGNAATPMGIKAMQALADGTVASNAMCLFLVINSSSVQLMPTTVIAMRAAAGSADPAAIVLPTLAATGISTVVAVMACKIAEKFS